MLSIALMQSLRTIMVLSPASLILVKTVFAFTTASREVRDSVSIVEDTCFLISSLLIFSVLYGFPASDLIKLHLAPILLD